MFKYAQYRNFYSVNHSDAHVQPYVPKPHMQPLTPKHAFHSVRLNSKAALAMILLVLMTLMNVWMNAQSLSTVGLLHTFVSLFVLILTMKT